METTYYIIRTSPGRLALVHSDTDKLVQLAGPNCAMPDGAFVPLLKAKGFFDTMVAENPDRMDRVFGGADHSGPVVGVGRLRSEKNCVTRAGLTNADAHDKKPLAGEVEKA